MYSAGKSIFHNIQINKKAREKKSRLKELRALLKKKKKTE